MKRTGGKKEEIHLPLLEVSINHKDLFWEEGKRQLPWPYRRNGGSSLGDERKLFFREMPPKKEEMETVSALP